MTLAAFIARWLGFACVVDPGGLGPQCVDLVNAWALVRGRPRLAGNAAQLLALAPPALWLRTANTPTNVTPAGAVVVWHGNVQGQAIGPDGHTAIALLADVDWLITLDQNWAGKEYAAVVVHPYAGVAGWLTPR